MASAVRKEFRSASMDVESASVPDFFARATDTVRAVLRRKSGMSLRDDDMRAANAEAIEVCHDVIARLWERHVENGGDASELDDATAFAATVAHNAWSDHLRQKYPRRASLKNRLRYFLSHQPKYRVWTTSDGDTVAGLHAWLVTGRTPSDGASLHALRDRQDKLDAGSVPRKAMERFTSDDWNTLLGALFDHARAPVSLDDLVRVVAALLDLEESHHHSLHDPADCEDDSDELPDLARLGPEALAETRSMLRQLWGAILALRADYRRAYLLNIPGAGKSRGDIEVFALHGIASIEAIAAAVGLDDQQYALLFAQLALSENDRVAVAACTDDVARFGVLWRQLPLPDAAIGALLGLEQQQVINRRMLALRELARMLAHRPRGARA